MPKTKITEVDNTGRTLQASSAVVYIPGPLVRGSLTSTNPTLYTTRAELASSTIAYDRDSLSYKLAYHLLSLGTEVVYQGLPYIESEEGTPTTAAYTTKLEADTLQPDVFTFVLSQLGDRVYTLKDNTISWDAGASGEETSAEVVDGTATLTVDEREITLVFDFINSTINYSFVVYLDAGVDTSLIDWNLLADKTIFNIRFLTLGGLNIQDASVLTDLQRSMIKCAAKRGDAIALLDAPVDIERGETINSNISSAIVQTVRTYFDGILTDTTVSTSDTGTYATCLSPHFLGTINEEEVEDIPASFGYLFAFSRSVVNNPTWYAVAGKFRGNVTELIAPVVEYTNADCEVLQARATSGEVELDEDNDRVGRAINPIANINPFGYLIWGNSTFKYNNGPDSLTASSFLNIRNLCCDLKKQLYYASKKYTFEQNDDVLWVNYKSEFTPLLDRMQSGRGIFGYKVQKLTTDRRARIKARITIVPIEAVEDFEIEVLLTNQDTTITE